MAQHKVVALGIDGPNPELLDAWLEAGLLPNIAAIGHRGVSGDYTHIKRFRNERCWDTFLSGREMSAPGSEFLPGSYEFFNHSLQREHNYEPFYALGDRASVCVFDLPAPLSARVEGLQLSGWASDFNASTPLSVPPDLIDEVMARHGADPKIDPSMTVRDFKSGDAEQTYSVPSLYDAGGLTQFRDKLLLSVARRTRIALDLLSRGDWDLFLGLYSESHTANHVLWHLGEAFPVQLEHADEGHALKQVYQAIDQGIGEVVASLPPGARVMVYTIDHTTLNTMDVPGMALLPEWLYRWCFRGSRALADSPPGSPVPPVRLDYQGHWKHQLWSLRTADGNRLLESPEQQAGRGDPLSWNPANWYRPLWPDMPAFALPSVADGFVRLNVVGREANGRIGVEEFSARCDELTKLLEGAVNPRTGRPLVKSVIRTRQSPFEAADIPPDLIVCWDDSFPADVLDCPVAGRIGPVPYFRSGGHVCHGTPVHNRLLACGPGLSPGARLRQGRLEDVSATILDLLGEAPAGGMTGRSLLIGLPAVGAMVSS